MSVNSELIKELVQVERKLAEASEGKTLIDQYNELLIRKESQEEMVNVLKPGRKKNDDISSELKTLNEKFSIWLKLINFKFEIDFLSAKNDSLLIFHAIEPEGNIPTLFSLAKREDWSLRNVPVNRYLSLYE